jgi:type I restriction enzyme S subunit
MGHIQRHHLREAKLAVPASSQLERITPFIEPMVESTWKRNVQSRTLAKTRDTLLPKLVSGEIRTGAATLVEDHR